MSKIGYNQGNNPFKRKKSPFNKQEGGFWNNYIDIDGDGKASAWEYGVEAATWIPTAIAAIGGTATTGVGGVPAAAATKTGIKQLIKSGVKWFAKNPKKTISGTGVGKIYQAGGSKKTTDMQDSGYKNTSDIPKDEDATNIFDK